MTARDYLIQRLQHGEYVFHVESGNSMTPRIKSRQPVILESVTINDLRIGDYVFCKVHGNYYTHLVYAIDYLKQRVQIGNNHGTRLLCNLILDLRRGHINGWTHTVYGRVIRILEMTAKPKYCIRCKQLDISRYCQRTHICKGANL